MARIDVLFLFSALAFQAQSFRHRFQIELPHDDPQVITKREHFQYGNGGDFIFDVDNFNYRKRVTKEIAKNVIRYEFTDEDITEMLKIHNTYRNHHEDTPDLVWDDKLAKDAQDYAEVMAKDFVKLGGDRGAYKLGKRVMKHDKNLLLKLNQGENLAASNYLTPGQAIDAWYREVYRFDWKWNDCQKGHGHMTQVLWKSSTKLGIGMAKGIDPTGYMDSIYVVARYQEPGNFCSKMTENVSPLKKEYNYCWFDNFRAMFMDCKTGGRKTAG